MNLQIPEGDFAGYIFDCDGTIADTMPLHYEAWCAALKEHDAHFPEALFYELGGTPTAKIVELLNERYGWNMPVAETVHRKEQLYLDRIPRVAPIEPVVQFVEQFAGKIPLAVASGGHLSIVRQTLTALGLVDKFQAIVTADQVARGKPYPDSYLEAARRLGVTPEHCLVFEDTEVGAEAARAAGMRYVIVPPPFRVQELLSKGNSAC